MSIEAAAIITPRVMHVNLRVAPTETATFPCSKWLTDFSESLRYTPVKRREEHEGLGKEPPACSLSFFPRSDIAGS